MATLRPSVMASGLAFLTLSLAAQPPQGYRGGRELEARLAAYLLQDPDLGQGLDERCAFRIRQEAPDTLGATHFRTDQFFQNRRVWGGEVLLRQEADGRLEITAETLARHIAVSPDPALAVSEALAVADALVMPSGPYANSPTAELVIYPVTRLAPKAGLPHPSNAQDFIEVTDRFELAYLIHTELEQDQDIRHEDLLINAHTGGLLRRWSTLHTDSHAGVGKSEYNGTVALSTNSIDGGYELRDMARAGSTTLDMGGSTSGSGSVYVNATDTWGDGGNYDRTQGTTSPNGQTAAVDAHYGMQMTWDFLKNVLGRNGIDGRGTPVSCRVHYSTSYDNAFWSDACFCMTFGDGSVFKTLTALDVATHEMGHGVCSSTANLAYTGESGGLNEADSDIFGTMVEFYAKGAQGQGSTVPDTGGNWTLGEQLATPQFSSPLRYMQKPSLDGRSPDAWSSTLGSLDVHFSSGPMNRAFYFLSQGASKDASSLAYSSYLPGGMAGVGNDKAIRIWWRTLSTRLTSTSNYLAARNGAIAAAQDLYGAASPEAAAVSNAFAAINVGSPATPGDTTPPTVKASLARTTTTLTCTATATDNKAVTRVDYWVDGTLKGSATKAPYTLSISLSSIPTGVHDLVAKAYDAAGNEGVSAAIPFAIDSVAPTVSAAVQGTAGLITLTASATDNLGVTRVDFLVDATLKGSATSSPYSLPFDATPLANGAHKLVAKAYDLAGNVGTSTTVTFTINNPDITPPTVSAMVARTSTTLSFSATAADKVGVTRVDYFVDGTLQGSTTKAPYTLTIAQTALSLGSHQLIAKACDAAGNVGVSLPVTFVADPIAPTVSARVDGTAGTLSFSATATDNLAVTRVDYFVDNTLAGSATTSPYPVSYNSIPLTNGAHKLLAKAYDQAGNVGLSAAVTFNVNNPDTTPPAVTAKFSRSGDTLSFSATATDKVGVVRVDYLIGDNPVGSAVKSPYTATLSAKTLPDGLFQLVAKAYDAAGNVGISAPVPFTVDTTAPTVTASVSALSGVLTFSALASDNIAVARVDFLVDGALKGTATKAPFTLALKATTFASGSHSLVAKAYDTTGNGGVSPSVPFSVDNTAPTVTAQTSGTAGTISLTAIASDNSGVTRVDYFVDGTLKGSATAAPYALDFDSTKVTNGSHKLVAKAYDPAGNVGTSATLTFTVNNVAAPTTITEIESNDTVATANRIPVTVKTVLGALSTGSDLDTFAITLVAGQVTQVTLTPPPGMIYGLCQVQGIRALAETTPTPAQGSRVLRLRAPAQASATETVVFIQVYSLTGQGSSAQYTLGITRK
jgi:Zn-dependent metalloprotease